MPGLTASRLAAAFAASLPMLQGALGQDLLGSASSLTQQATSQLTKMTDYVNSAHEKSRAALSTASQLSAKAQEHVNKAQSVYQQAKGELGGHMQKASGMKAKVEGMACSVLNVMCDNAQNAAAGGAAPASCADGRCCPRSSCYSNSVPFLKCDGERGTSSCLGASVLTGKGGVCGCASGACGADGRCPGAPAAALQAAAPNSFTGLYDHRASAGGVGDVPQEHFLVPFGTAMFVTLGSITLLAYRFSRARPKRSSRTASRATLLVEDGELLE